MIAVSVVLAMASSAALLASGYLYGARRGRAVRAALASDVAQKADELAQRAQTIARQQQQISDLTDEMARRAPAKSEAEVLLDARRGDVGELRDELRGFMRALSEQERGQDALREELRQVLSSLSKQTSDPEKLNRDIQKVLQPLLRRQEDSAHLREMMREMLAPVLERDRIGKELSQLQAGSGLGELPRMLDAISERGGFSTVVLSDEVGLPLAANSGALNVEMLAGIASFLLTLADRAERNGTPRPQAVVVLDESNQTVLHRIFSVDASRFVLTAVSRGVYVAPGALDAALGKIEQVLSKRLA